MAQTNRRTWRLYDQLGQWGRVGEKTLYSVVLLIVCQLSAQGIQKVIYFLVKNHIIFNRVFKFYFLLDNNIVLDQTVK